ncbi:MAG: hypothetical protein V3T01_06540 [Myxococcota bacterium]
MAAGTLSRPDKEQGGEEIQGQCAIRHDARLTDAAPPVNRRLLHRGTGCETAVKPAGIMNKAG